MVVVEITLCTKFSSNGSNGFTDIGFNLKVVDATFIVQVLHRFLTFISVVKFNVLTYLVRQGSSI